MRRITLTAVLLTAFWAAGAAAQNAPPERGTAATQADVWCAGGVTTEGVPSDTYVISGEEADPKIVFTRGDYIYINKGSSQGAKVGDEYMVMRPVNDPSHISWFHEEFSLSRLLGQQWVDLGRARVVVVHPSVAIAQVTYSCDYIQRSDIVRPAVQYPAPVFKPLKDLDRFAAPSGKPQGRLVRAKNYSVAFGRGSVVYINLTNKDGVKPGDYIRIFRYASRGDDTSYFSRGEESTYQVHNLQDRTYGFGKTPRTYSSKDLPREILGEAVVLRTSASSATVLVFNSLREMYLGDFLELE